MKSAINIIIKITILVVVACVIILGTYVYSVAMAVNLDSDVMTQKNTSLEVYDVNGDLINLYGYKKNLAYEDIPQHLIDAFVCIEDKNFFNHDGVDFLRIAKAMVKNILSLSPNKEGASTITQQFIKNTHLTLDKTYTRKIQEIKLALELEQKYSKEEIITAYFNILYFGNSIYGISSACENFFGKECKDITISESATLAGVVKNPAKYSPLRNYQNSLDRRNFILKEMYQDKFISENEYISAIEEELILSETKNKTGLTFLNSVIEEATSLLGLSETELAYGAFKIYTEYDPNLQKSIESELKNKDYLPLSESGKESDAYALVTNNESGLISAYYNTYPCIIENFYRQPGSTIKPFVSYLPGISSGLIHPASPVLDEKVNIDGYSPKNFANRYYGWTNVRSALSKSLNSVAVRLMHEYGVDKSINYAKKYGISFVAEDYTLATALGGMTNGVNPIEITSAYMALANGGYYKRTGFIKKIVNSNSEVLFENSAIPFKNIEKEENIYLITDILRDCALNGTASRLGITDYQVAAKTGTVAYQNSTKNNDIWNLSYTSENTLCVWMGNVDNSEENALDKNSLAGVYPTRVAKNILDNLYKDRTPFDFPIPTGIVELAYSKEKFNNEHILVEASEYCTYDEVIYDIFSSTTTLKKVDQSIQKELFKEYEITIDNNQPLISFMAEDNVTYRIFKTSLLSEMVEVDTVVGKGNIVRLKDENVTPGMDYVYTIDAMIVNYKNEVIHLGTSDEKYVILPFDFWVN